MNTLINADDELSAMQSIAGSIGGSGALGKARTLIEQIKSKHSAIADAFGTGAGLRLMRVDSDMAETVLLRLIGRGIVGLPIHDSFIVEERHSGILAQTMDDVLDLTLQRISGSRPLSIWSSKNVPQYGGGGEGVRGGGNNVGIGDGTTGRPANDNGDGIGGLGVA